MAERVPWWWAFMGKRRSSATTPQTHDTDQNPLAAQTEGPTGPASASKPQTDHQQPQTQHPKQPEQPQASRGTSLFSDETVDDSQFEPVFNEQTCRRNLRVSRSGRFKEKRRVRSSLPLDNKDQDKDKAGKEDAR